MILSSRSVELGFTVIVAQQKKKLSGVLLSLTNPLWEGLSFSALRQSAVGEAFI